MIELFETLVGEQKKRAVVMVGRMNPPTAGHYKVIDSMKAFIRDNPKLALETSPVVVIIAGKQTSEDKARNPLTAEERQSFMMSSGRADGVKFLISNSAFAAFQEVRKAGYEPVAIAAGSDRREEYMRILEKHFTTADGANIKHHAVPGLDRDADADHNDGEEAFAHICAEIEEGKAVPLSMISGSLARYAADNDRKDAFAYITGLTQKPKLAAQLMKKISKAMKEA